ncbi:MAG: hypothetical protein CSB55_09040 [Candidatus Cloacimonadota bacterium]|nr:MAG: hypothetical protein CSB55_09040 [Candidatus Cloacimonadota bacterium]
MKPDRKIIIYALLCLLLGGCLPETIVADGDKSLPVKYEKITSPGGFYPGMHVGEYKNRMRMNERSGAALRTENGDYYYLFGQRCRLLSQKKDGMITEFNYLFKDSDYAVLHKFYLDWKNYLFNLYGQAVINKNNHLKWIKGNTVIELYFLAGQNIAYCKFYLK